MTTNTKEYVWLCFSCNMENGLVDCDVFKALTTNIATQKVEKIIQNYKRDLIEDGMLETYEYAECVIEKISDTVITGCLNMENSYIQFAAYRVEDLLNNMQKSEKRTRRKYHVLFL